MKQFCATHYQNILYIVTIHEPHPNHDTLLSVKPIEQFKPCPIRDRSREGEIRGQTIGVEGRQKILAFPVSRWERPARSPVHTVKIAEPVDVSKPAECRNYSLRCTLYSRGFLCVIRSLSSPYPRTPPIFRLPLLLPLSLTGLSLFSPPLSGHPGRPLSSLYLAYPAATLPPLCVNSCTYRQRAGYLRGKGCLYSSGNVYLRIMLRQPLFPPSCPRFSARLFFRRAAVSALLTPLCRPAVLGTWYTFRTQLAPRNSCNGDGVE